MFLGSYNPLVYCGVALGTVVTTGADSVMNPFGRIVNAMELFELSLGGFVEGEVL